MQYSLIDDGRAKVLTVLSGGMPYVATSDTHPNFNELVLRAIQGDESVVEAFTVEKAVADRFEALSERVSVAGGQVYFDGDPVDNALTEQILRFVDADVTDWMPLVNFFEKVQQNPNEHSREQLFRWLAKHKFTLTRDGDIVGYKGVQSDFTSVHAGPAIVDGRAMNGHIPNLPGSTLEMARSRVQFDPSVGCAEGLHVANWRYASSWSDKTLEVHVNPRDVVSVPTDSNDEKVRVCRYVVISEVTEPYDGPVLEAVQEETDEEDYYEGDDDPEICDDCGDYLEDCRGLCDDFDEEPVDPWYVNGGVASGKTSAGKSDGVFNLNVNTYGKVDTRLNHTVQQRDANGRFIPKS